MIPVFADGKEKNNEKRKIKAWFSVGGNWLDPGPILSYDYSWSIFDEKYTGGYVSSHAYLGEIYENSLYGGSGNIGVLFPFRVIGIRSSIEVYGGYSYNLIKQKGCLSFTASNLKHLPTTRDNPWGFDEVADFNKQVYSTVTGERDYKIRRDQIDLGIAYHLQIPILQPYVGAGLSRINFSVEVPKYFVFKEWYSGYVEYWECKIGKTLYGWPAFIPEEFKVLFSGCNTVPAETESKKHKIDLFHFRVGLSLHIEKGLMLFAEGIYTRELTEYGDFKLEAHGSEIVYFWREQGEDQSADNSVWGIVSDKRIYVPQDKREYKLRLGGWNLKAGIRIMF